MTVSSRPIHTRHLPSPTTPPSSSPNEQASVNAFNVALKDCLGSEEMVASLGKNGFSKASLPDGTRTAELCKGRSKAEM